MLYTYLWITSLFRRIWLIWILGHVMLCSRIPRNRIAIWNLSTRGGHINAKLISRMLVDGGAIVNLMPYSLLKKLGGTDEELIKTNMMVSGVSGGDPIGAKGVASMELTVGSKMLATTFFISEVQGNFSLILGCDWIHDNHCAPSTLHQFLI